MRTNPNIEMLKRLLQEVSATEVTEKRRMKAQRKTFFEID